MLWHMKADWQSDGSKSRWLRAATDQVFLTVWIFSILSSSQCSQRLWIMHETDFFFKYSDSSGQVINRISSWQERNLIKNVFIICGERKKQHNRGCRACLWNANLRWGARYGTRWAVFQAASLQTVFVFWVFKDVFWSGPVYPFCITKTS